MLPRASVSDVPSPDPSVFYDEARERDGTPRPHYRALLGSLEARDLDGVAREIREEVRARGMRYGESGPDAFVVDAVPRVLSAAEWDALADGLIQRLRALAAFVLDAYGDRQIVAAGRIPARVIEGSELYEPDLRGVELRGGWLGAAGPDVVRGADGVLRVLEDNLRLPTGFAYAAHAREIVAPRLVETGAVPRPNGLNDISILARALRAAAPDGRGDPAIAVLGDDPANPAGWEVRDVARRLGVPVVSHADLEVREGRVWARTGAERRPVDVLYRRTDIDALRADGRPTPAAVLLEPLRRRTLAVVNPYGSGVADDKLAHAYVPEMIRFYLGEEPRLASARAFDLADPTARQEVMERLDEMAIKPRAEAGGAGVVIGPFASGDELDDARRAIERAPEDYVAQESIALSRHPTLIDGALVPRRVDLRALVVADGIDVSVVPGGIARVALAEDALMVNMAQGGGIKDVWVLEEAT